MPTKSRAEMEREIARRKASSPNQRPQGINRDQVIGQPPPRDPILAKGRTRSEHPTPSGLRSSSEDFAPPRSLSASVSADDRMLFDALSTELREGNVPVERLQEILPARLRLRQGGAATPLAAPDAIAAQQQQFREQQRFAAQPTQAPRLASTEDLVAGLDFGDQSVDAVNRTVNTIGDPEQREELRRQVLRTSERDRLRGILMSRANNPAEGNIFNTAATLLKMPFASDEPVVNLPLAQQRVRDREERIQEGIKETADRAAGFLAPIARRIFPNSDASLRDTPVVEAPNIPAPSDVTDLGKGNFFQEDGPGDPVQASVLRRTIPTVHGDLTPETVSKMALQRRTAGGGGAFNNVNILRDITRSYEQRFKEIDEQAGPHTALSSRLKNQALLQRDAAIADVLGVDAQLRNADLSAATRLAEESGRSRTELQKAAFEERKEDRANRREDRKEAFRDAASYYDKEKGINVYDPQVGTALNEVLTLAGLSLHGISDVAFANSLKTAKSIAHIAVNWERMTGEQFPGWEVIRDGERDFDIDWANLNSPGSKLKLKHVFTEMIDSLPFVDEVSAFRTRDGTTVSYEELLKNTTLPRHHLTQLVRDVRDRKRKDADE